MTSPTASGPSAAPPPGVTYPVNATSKLPANAVESPNETVIGEGDPIKRSYAWLEDEIGRPLCHPNEPPGLT